MKKTKTFIFAGMLFLAGTALFSCSSNVIAEYKCPMECEGDKIYDELGKCPVCKMELVKISEIEKDDI